MIINGQTTMMVDMEELVDAFRSEWMVEKGVPGIEESAHTEISL